jgi:hypothetical protein
MAQSDLDWTILTSGRATCTAHTRGDIADRLAICDIAGLDQDECILLGNKSNSFRNYRRVHFTIIDVSVS